MKFSLIVTDSGPLITLAVANALDVMFLPGRRSQAFVAQGEFAIHMDRQARHQRV